MIKRNSQSETRKSVSETAGLTVDTTEKTDVKDVPPTRRTGNGEGRKDKETQAKTLREPGSPALNN